MFPKFTEPFPNFTSKFLIFTLILPTAFCVFLMKNGVVGGVVEVKKEFRGLENREGWDEAAHLELPMISLKVEVHKARW